MNYADGDLRACPYTANLLYRGEKVKISNLLSAYRQSLTARATEAQELASKIARLEASQRLNPSDRLLSRIGVLKHRQNTINCRHRTAACWVSSVATPVFQVLSKYLGNSYRANLIKISDGSVSLRFACINRDRVMNGITGLNLRLCLNPIANAGMPDIEFGVETEIVRINQDVATRIHFALDSPIQQMLEA